MTKCHTPILQISLYVYVMQCYVILYAYADIIFAYNFTCGLTSAEQSAMSIPWSPGCSLADAAQDTVLAIWLQEQQR